MTAHTKTKFRQQQNQNFQLRLQLNEQLNKMDEVRICNASTRLVRKSYSGSISLVRNVTWVEYS